MAPSSRLTNLMLGDTVLWAALCLASHDFNLMPTTTQWSRQRKNRYILKHFDDNVDLFYRFWRVEWTLAEYMRMNVLVDLGMKDLAIFCTLLRRGWHHELEVFRGDGLSLNSHIWVTSAKHS